MVESRQGKWASRRLAPTRQEVPTRHVTCRRLPCIAYATPGTIGTINLTTGNVTKRNLYFAGGLAVMLLAASFAGLNMFSSQPDDLGVHEGRLAPCPSSPNCVSSQATDDLHRMPPIPFTGTSESAVQRITAVLQQMPRVTCLTVNGTYVHAEARSAIFRFVDDMEFLVDSERNQIEFLSRSRVGHSDLGVNRSRMERFRELFTREPE